MKKELIAKLFKEFEKACYEYKNIECWSSRDLQEILGYSEWRNFEKVIDKAKIACRNSGQEIDDHFVDVNKMVINFLPRIPTGNFCLINYLLKISPFTISQYLLKVSTTPTFNIFILITCLLKFFK